MKSSKYKYALYNFIGITTLLYVNEDILNLMYYLIVTVKEINCFYCNNILSCSESKVSWVVGFKSILKSERGTVRTRNGYEVNCEICNRKYKAHLEVHPQYMEEYLRYTDTVACELKRYYPDHRPITILTACVGIAQFTKKCFEIILYLERKKCSIHCEKNNQQYVATHVEPIISGGHI